MTDPRYIAMVRGQIARERAYLAEQAQRTECQAEMFLSAETDQERDTLVEFWSIVGSPEPPISLHERIARTRARKRAQRAARPIDMSAFEAQFTGGVS